MFFSICLLESMCKYKNLCVKSPDFPNITNHIACQWFFYVTYFDVILEDFLKLTKLSIVTIHCLSMWRICIKRIESANGVPQDLTERFQIGIASHLITITLLSFLMQIYKFRYIFYITMDVISFFISNVTILSIA